MSNCDPGVTTSLRGLRRGYHGKYRGTVMNNVDPEFRGRILVQVPDVFGPNVSSWALPCTPFGGQQSGAYIVPPLQSQVWIEFENGDIDFPVWVGAFWGGAGAVPATSKENIAPPPGQNIVIQTTGQTMLGLSDSPAPMQGGIMLQQLASSINITESMITITVGQTQLIISPTGVTINTPTQPLALVVQ